VKKVTRAVTKSETLLPISGDNNEGPDVVVYQVRRFYKVLTTPYTVTKTVTISIKGQHSEEGMEDLGQDGNGYRQA
jgi:hypothetical protein